METYSELNSYIKDNFPNFVKSKHYDNEWFLDGSSTLFIGTFGSYIDDLIINKCVTLSDLENNIDLKKTIEFINNNINNTNKEIVNTINLELIERFEDTKNSIIYAKRYLNNKARRMLEFSIEWTENYNKTHKSNIE